MKKYEIYKVTLDPAVGSEEAKRRPCAIISPNVLNENLSTYTIVPITSKVRNFAFRVKCHVEGREGELMCEQIRTVSIKRFGSPIEKLGELSSEEANQLKKVLYKMFCED
ncbi:MAG: type II toxin-antitoxin system PemK/MazF family toxin [Bacteroidales bacterium]|nr:type II toxin-antitoxin system PemK/MazF family toxin [Candidatus Scybalocola fimicaballi]